MMQGQAERTGPETQIQRSNPGQQFKQIGDWYVPDQSCPIQTSGRDRTSKMGVGGKQT